MKSSLFQEECAAKHIPYVPPNKLYLKQNLFKIELFNSSINAFQPSYIMTEILYNVTHYKQPSTDPTLQCLALVFNGEFYGDLLDLVSIPCQYKIPHTMQVCMNQTRSPDSYTIHENSIKPNSVFNFIPKRNILFPPRVHCPDSALYNIYSKYIKIHTIPQPRNCSSTVSWIPCIHREA